MIDLLNYTRLREDLEAAATLADIQAVRERARVLAANAAERPDRASWRDLFVRASFRMGEISNDLPKAHRFHTSRAGDKPKALQLIEAKVSAITISELERLAGRTPARRAAAKAVMEAYLAEARRTAVIPTVSKLRLAVENSALTKTHIP
jgi:hypothetical protein